MYIVLYISSLASLGIKSFIISYHINNLSIRYSNMEQIFLGFSPINFGYEIIIL